MLTDWFNSSSTADRMPDPALFQAVYDESFPAFIIPLFVTILQHHKLKCSPKLRQSIHYFFYKWLWTLTAVPSWSPLYILITICHWYLLCAAFFPISWEHSKSFLGLHHHHQNLFVAANFIFFLCHFPTLFHMQIKKWEQNTCFGHMLLVTSCLKVPTFLLYVDPTVFILWVTCIGYVWMMYMSMLSGLIQQRSIVKLTYYNSL